MAAKKKVTTKKKATKKKAANHYVDNAKFFDEMVSYVKSLQEAKEHDRPKPRVPEYVGECFLKIATHLSYKPNFINYTYREDMISDGVENCLQYLGNFDPEKSKNPFAYFTQIIYYAFLRRIQKEKKQLYVKYKAMSREDGDTSDYENVHDFITEFEKKMEEQKQRNLELKRIKAAAKGAPQPKFKGLEEYYR